MRTPNSGSQPRDSLFEQNQVGLGDAKPGRGGDPWSRSFRFATGAAYRAIPRSVSQ